MQSVAQAIPADTYARQHQFLRISILTMAVLMVAAATSTALIITGSFLGDPAVQATAVALVTFALSFWFNETKRTQLASRIFVAATFLVVWVFTVQIQGSGYLVGNYAYLVTVVLLASFLVPPLETGLYAVGNLVGIYYLWSQTGLGGTDLILSISYQIIFSGMLVVMSTMRRNDAQALLERSSELTASNKALHDANEEKSILLEYTADAILHVAHDGRIVSANPSGRIWTQDASDWRHLPEPVRVLAEDAPAVAQLDLEDAPAKRIQLQAVPVDVPRPGARVLFISDRTAELRGLEDERLRLEQAALMESYQKEAQMQRRFLNLVSHELRTPVTTLKLQLALLLSHAGNLGKKNKPIVDRSLDRLDRLLEDILDLGYLKEGRLPLHVSIIEAVETVRAVVDVWQDVAVSKGLEFKFDLQPHMLEADPVRLRQLADNLLANASKFTNKGSIAFSLRQEENTSIMTVRDTGIGFEPEIAEKLFTPFGRPHEESLSISGAGLGLSICQGIVLSHGGTFTARSEGLGKGAEFEIRLPLSQNGSA